MNVREQYAQEVKKLADGEPTYKIGGDCRNGKGDCVGIGIGALREMDIDYNGEHSTNWVARREAVELWEITSINQLRIGDNVLKAYEPHETKWALPKRFRSYKDTRDYYHMGVVTSVNPLKITHMTSPTARVDTKLGDWRFAFLWRQLSGKDEKPMIYEARVRLATSRYLNLRAGKGVDTADIGDIPNGAIVEVIEDNAPWPRIRYEGKEGYVSAEYLEKVNNEEKAPVQKESAGRLVVIDSQGKMFYPEGEVSIRYLSEGDTVD